MNFADIEPDDLLAQLAEMEDRLTGCCNALCVCGKGDVLDPALHWELCPYSVAAESGVDGDKSNGPGEPACKDCGLPYSEFGMDTVIPNSQWVDIHPGRTEWADCNGLLCASCMVKRASRLEGKLVAWMAFVFVPGDRTLDEESVNDEIIN